MINEIPLTFNHKVHEPPIGFVDFEVGMNRIDVTCFSKDHLFKINDWIESGKSVTLSPVMIDDKIVGVSLCVFPLSDTDLMRKTEESRLRLLEKIKELKPNSELEEKDE